LNEILNTETAPIHEKINCKIYPKHCVLPADMFLREAVAIFEGSIPGTTRKKSSGSGMGSTQPCEYN
jgi:hypothetical protein